MIEECGGHAKVMEKFGITRRTVQYWIERGMRMRIEMQMRGAFPTAYARWKAKQEQR
ncbi:hypothetical protein [Petrachloros mirabilis]